MPCDYRAAVRIILYPWLFSFTPPRKLRIFYAFDPRRTSILLIGGDKSGNDRFYEAYVPVADDLYDEHLEELRREGLIK